MDMSETREPTTLRVRGRAVAAGVLACTALAGIGGLTYLGGVDDHSGQRALPSVRLVAEAAPSFVAGRPGVLGSVSFTVNVQDAGSWNAGWSHAWNGCRKDYPATHSVRMTRHDAYAGKYWQEWDCRFTA